MAQNPNSESSSRISRLVVVTFGTFEVRNGEYYGKQQVVDYLHDLSEHFEEVIALGNESDGSYFSARVDQDRVTPKLTAYQASAEQPASVSSVLRANFELLQFARGNTAVLLNAPAILYAPVTPLLPFVTRHLSTYLRANPADVASLQRSRDSDPASLKARLTEFQSWFLSRFSDTLLFRGSEQRYEDDSNAIQSKPIVSLPDRDSIDSRNNDNTTILYVGGLYERKGVTDLIDAFAELVSEPEFEGAELRIVGKGERLEPLQQQAEELSVSNAVEFVGWVDDVTALAREYKSADVFVLPSLSAEGSPRCIDEAQYYGVPVVASDLGYYEESLEHEENVLFVTPGSQRDLRRGIQRLLDDDQLRNRLRRNGRERMDAKLDQSAADQHAEIIKQSTTKPG